MPVRSLPALLILTMGMIFIIFLMACVVAPPGPTQDVSLPTHQSQVEIATRPASLPASTDFPAGKAFRPAVSTPASASAHLSVPAAERAQPLAVMLRQLRSQPTQTPAAPSEIIRHGDRIDKIGPVPVPTIVPLEQGDGLPPVRLQIPVLALDTPVERMGWKWGVGVSRWDVVAFAAGHHFNSAYPGERGNVVISGHNNIEGAVFGPVCVIGQPGVALGVGDAIILTDRAGRRFTYRIDGWHRMAERNASVDRRQDNARYLQATETARLTLITCWPLRSNTHRVVVTAALTEICGPSDSP